MRGQACGPSPEPPYLQKAGQQETPRFLCMGTKVPFVGRGPQSCEIGNQHEKRVCFIDCLKAVFLIGWLVDRMCSWFTKASVRLTGRSHLFFPSSLFWLKLTPDLGRQYPSPATWWRRLAACSADLPPEHPLVNALAP